jgi:CopG family transcriptional regulator, nickel-responsive regulator
MDKRLIRTCISLPESLLDRFDEIIKKRGYSSRSEGIRDSIRHTVVHYEWMNEVDGKRLGVISFLYEHNQRGLVDDLARIQHEHAGLIISSIHVHLDHDECLENVILQGEGKHIKALAEKIMALKGVKYIKFNTIPQGSSFQQSHDT